MNSLKLNSYLDLPPLAGVCAFEEATRVGYGVEENVALLKRYHFALKRVWKILISRINNTPIYELKMGFSYHAHILAENISEFRKRVGEMREPPLGLDESPDAALEIFFDEIRAAESYIETMIGVYEIALPSLEAAAKRHLSETNPLVDQPTMRLLGHLLADLERFIQWGRASVEKLVETLKNPAAAEKWRMDFSHYLAAAGGIDGKSEPTDLPARTRSLNAFECDLAPRRDERFSDPFNMGVHAEKFIYDESYPVKVRDLMLLFKRIREIDVPEAIAGIIMRTPGKPWEYYRDMSRQLWDEARHALMGEVGFTRLGLDWTQTLPRHTFGWELNTLLSATEAHAILFTIEQNLMPKTGKKFEWELAKEAGDDLTATFQDYDWADEVLHARIGRDWFAPEYKGTAAAKKVGDAAFEKLNAMRPDYKALGWTEHENWWPEFYKNACEVLGWKYDERVAAYNLSELGSVDAERGIKPMPLTDLIKAGGLSA